MATELVSMELIITLPWKILDTKKMENISTIEECFAFIGKIRSSNINIDEEASRMFSQEKWIWGARKSWEENRKIEKKTSEDEDLPNGNENTKRNDAEKMSNLCYRRLSELNGSVINFISTVSLELVFHIFRNTFNDVSLILFTLSF